MLRLWTVRIWSLTLALILQGMFVEELGNINILKVMVSMACGNAYV